MLAATIIAIASSTPAVAAPCEALIERSIPSGSVTAARSVAGGPFTPPGARNGRALEGLPAFCRVEGLLRPTPTSAIRFEVWLPESGWNGRLQVVGNGGLAGTISYPAMAAAVQSGFATASTDTGHTATEPPTWLEDRERLVDYSSRGLHLTTVQAKAILGAYYGQPATYAYYTGCSTGGKQGLMEAQRYPEDFDGILAGHAANFWTHQMAGEVWNGLVTSTPETNLPKEALQLVQDAAVAACDTLDGAPDGLVSNPMRCTFDPGVLQCTGAGSASCLTPSQVEAVRNVYRGPTSRRNGKNLYPGFYPGGEMGWASGVVINRETTSGVSSNDFWAYALFHNPDWAFRTFDVDRDLDKAMAELAPITNATSPDLSAFNRLGHKLVYYHGAADPLIPAQNGVDYYESVVAATGGLERTQEFFRAFLVPGLYHCSGGPGPIAFGTTGAPPEAQRDADHDIFKALQRWVESGAAPARIIATKYVDGDPAKGVALQRPLCLYPQVATYTGSGEMNDAASFVCAAPK
ncbi:MAG: tannase/feruloyl esterase family alpha/beta hydrolase [Acidobacteriota bacterium]|nr:tannase/feruloyl esterase family alpha/beta hydrolase [Acidobacteriota bacterium]